MRKQHTWRRNGVDGGFGSRSGCFHNLRALVKALETPREPVGVEREYARRYDCGAKGPVGDFMPLDDEGDGKSNVEGDTRQKEADGKEGVRTKTWHKASQRENKGRDLASVRKKRSGNTAYVALTSMTANKPKI